MAHSSTYTSTSSGRSPAQIATSEKRPLGWRQAGFKGALAATFGIVLPSFLIIWMISLFLEELMMLPLVEAAFKGVRIAVGLLIIRAGWTMVQKMLKKTPNKKHSIAFVAVFFLIVLAANILGVKLSTVWLILTSGLIGFCLYGLPGRKGRAEK